MVKSIIKEIIIILLLLVAIVLAFGVLFYDYLPANKAVPSVSAYTTSQSVQEELNAQVADSEAVIVSYELTANDLSTYESTNDYTKGKANPFAEYTEEVEGEEDGNSSTTNSNITSSVGSSSSSTGNSTNSTSTNTNNTFYSNTGTK